MIMPNGKQMSPSNSWLDYIVEIDSYFKGVVYLLPSSELAEMCCDFMNRCPTETIWEARENKVIGFSLSDKNLGEYIKTFRPSDCSYYVKERTDSR